MRARLGVVLVAALVLASCGGDDGDDEQAADDDVALATEAIVDLDPCGLLDRDTAAALTGAEVEEVDDDPVTSLASLIGCSYRGDGAGAGGAIAASLVLGGTDEEPEAAKDARLAELAPGAQGDAEDLDLGDAGAVVATDDVVQVVYVVEQVVVSVEVTPADAVDPGAVDAVVAFAEGTVEPVRQAIEAKAQRDRDAGATTTTAEASDGAAADDVVQQGEIEGLWTGDWGTMAIEVDGDQVRAAYTHDDGRITGTFDDGVFRGRWTEVPTREGPNDAGSVEFRFAKTDDGTIALDGRWDYDGDEEPLGHDDWDLTLSEDEVPPELLDAFDDEESFEP